MLFVLFLWGFYNCEEQTSSYVFLICFVNSFGTPWGIYVFIVSNFTNDISIHTNIKLCQKWHNRYGNDVCCVM